ncbi:metallophosphatase [Thermosipho melanesiensis]|uniref:Metallophosphoesterase n=2 Tax=Thermosipho melanesiensis TaxID=46541 RepID=A6LMX0_THEM4|nr:metallophosphoesterase [Thermosipho melanesiensis]ABR31271.1 metallophosphoesterase [Thermosipho melanesiensis BI429]APT74352.1 metallophosphatase [Thermosipho melanesiensis]OOC36294.1 metallophosphatase [Thermosipho melanesiensis]OOC37112.1 metallophosphatase [Thermosipho melanesiensis]OOC37864.1 metallophosphatase [Thermosipho melanesiensis]
MERYLFLSDLHVGDGRRKDDFEQDYYFEKLIKDFSENPNVTLFIVGDVFEFVESELTLEIDLDNYEKDVENLSADIIDEYEKSHPLVFSALRKIGKRGKIYYIVGNHDYYIFKNKKLLERLLEKIPNLQVLPYYYNEKLKLFVVHGNQFDPVNNFSIEKETGKLVPPLGEYIVKYMMKNFDSSVKVPKQIAKDYDNVRPTLDLFDWFEVISKKYDIGIDLLRFWIDEFLNMMKTKEAKKWMKTNYPFWSMFSKIFLNNFGGIKFGELLVRIIMNFRTLKKTDYLLKKAKRILNNKIDLEKYMVGYNFKHDVGGVDGIIMGHIHKHNFKVFNMPESPKFYINCGSWKPVVERIKGKVFHKKNELFYAVLNVGKDVEIITSTVSMLKKREVIF